MLVEQERRVSSNASGGTPVGAHALALLLHSDSGRAGENGREERVAVVARNVTGSRNFLNHSAFFKIPKLDRKGCVIPSTQTTLPYRDGLKSGPQV